MRILIIFTSFFVCSCGINIERIKMQNSNESLITSYSDFIILNKEKLEYINGRKVSAGMQNVKFDGELYVKTSEVIEPREMSSATCVALLPLCIVDKLSSKDNINVRYKKSHCFAKLEFVTVKGLEYKIEFENDADYMPRILVFENDTAWEQMDYALLECTPI